MGQDRKIIEGEFNDMEVIDTSKTLKHDYINKDRIREKLEEKEDEEGKKFKSGFEKRP